tara:strand:+ start:372 stop:479 length:108 start_codon:yes stop_codon:yes gene_type:complete
MEVDEKSNEDNGEIFLKLLGDGRERERIYEEFKIL